MKTMIYSLALCASLACLASCSDDDSSLTQRDWEGTDTYFASEPLGQSSLFYKPAVGFVGDPMPFYDPQSNDFKILYLQDFRPNQALTYHPIWCVTTKDAASYESLGEIVPCGASTELDAALGTGSCFFDNGTYYIFYTAHSPNFSQTAGINEAVMVATSTDFKTWKKDRAFLLDGGDTYSLTDYRDPFVWKGDDGKYHMIVSTRKNGKGVLAEYLSDNLKDWTSNGEFMTMMWDRFYECPDVFKMGDWWYLIYSEQHDAVRRVQYFKGRTLDELKACTANDAGIWPDSHEGFLDGRGFYAGKTASNGTDRYIWGWSASKNGSATNGTRDWAGYLVAHKLIQHPDGTLTLGEVPAIESKLGAVKSIESFSMNAGEHKLLPRLGTTNRIHMTLTASADARFGFSFGRGSDSESYYSLIVNPEGGSNRKINLEQEGGAGFIGDNDSYLFQAPENGVYDITIVTDNCTLALYINDTLCYTNVIYGIRNNGWSVNCYDGSVNVTEPGVASATEI